MAKVRYIGDEPVTVPELGEYQIHPDQVVVVPDERFDGYMCQPGTWQAVEEPKEEKEGVEGSQTAEAPVKKIGKMAKDTKGADH